MRYRIVIGCFLLMVLLGNIQAQDIQLTQFYASPTYLNPAFTGANADSRLATTYRNQWAALPGTFSSFIVSYDQYFNQYRSGFGVQLASDRIGSMALTNNFLAATYAYDYKFHRNWSASFGLAAGYGYRSLDYNQLVFGDQIARGASTSLQTPTVDKVNYFDISAGALIFSENEWLGISAKHINFPNESLLEQKAALPLKGSLHGGMNIHIGSGRGYGRKSDRPVIVTAFQYRFQEKYDQFDIGFYYKRPNLFAGIWYRGIPIFKAYKKGYGNNDAVAFLVGGMYKQFILGYSYDFTISRLGMASGGSHEISLGYQYYNPKKPKHKRTKIIPCPKF